MRKAAYILFFIFSTFLGSLVLVLSTGWFLALFGLLLLPILILHVVAGIVALNKYPLFTRWSIMSWIAFCLFALARPDIDDVNSYTGFSVFLYKLSVIDSHYITSTDYLFYIAMAMLLLMLVLDVLICIKARRKKTLPPFNDYV